MPVIPTWWRPLVAPTPTATSSTASLVTLTTLLPTASLIPQVADVAEWHINADEIPLFDYNDDVKDTVKPHLRKSLIAPALRSQ